MNFCFIWPSLRYECIVPQNYRALLTRKISQSKNPPLYRFRRGDKWQWQVQPRYVPSTLVTATILGEPSRNNWWGCSISRYDPSLLLPKDKRDFCSGNWASRLTKWTRSIYGFCWTLSSNPVCIQFSFNARQSNMCAAHESPNDYNSYYTCHPLSDLREILTYEWTQWKAWKEFWGDSENGYGLDERLFILFLQLSTETDKMNYIHRWSLLRLFVWYYSMSCSNPVSIQFPFNACQSNMCAAHESPMITTKTTFELHFLSDLRRTLVHEETRWNRWRDSEEIWRMFLGNQVPWEISQI